MILVGIISVWNDSSSDLFSLYMIKSWNTFSNIKFHTVVTVCNNAVNETCPIYPGSPNKLHWDLEDPAAFNGNDEKKLNEFQRIFDQIHERIKKEFLNT